VIGNVSTGQRVRFLPGSLDAAARPVLLRDHDPRRALGRVVDASETDAGMTVSARISAVAAGDDALVLASDGVLSMFSVGANPTQYHYDDDVLVVEAADWQELSLLPLGAFPTATVSTVAATALPPEGTPTVPELAPAPTIEPVPALPVIAAGPVPIPITTNAPALPRPDLSIRGVARMIAAGARAPEIMAALTNVITDDIDGAADAGIVWPAFSSEVRGLIAYGRPTINAIDRAPLPPSGMRVEWPVWGTLPLVDMPGHRKDPGRVGPGHDHQRRDRRAYVRRGQRHQSPGRATLEPELRRAVPAGHGRDLQPPDQRLRDHPARRAATAVPPAASFVDTDRSDRRVVRSAHRARRAVCSSVSRGMWPRP
jgi:HK97 family phage prohead protease